MSGIKTQCRKCAYDISKYSATVEITRHHPVIYCPVCASEIHDFRETKAGGIFYDFEVGAFIKWVPPRPVLAGQDVETLTSGNLTIELHVKPVDYSKIFYDHVLVFLAEDGKAGPAGEPVDFQRFASPENCTRYGIKIISAQVQSNGNFVDVKFQLNGEFNGHLTTTAALTKPVYDTNKGLTIGAAALKVWPDFKRQGRIDDTGYKHAAWSDYFVYFASSDKSIKTEFARVTGEEGRELQLDGGTPKGELSFCPEYIEICANVTKDGGRTFEKYMSCFKVNLRKVNEPRQNAKLRLSVDFGTSNTCFSYSVPVPGGHGSYSDSGDLKLSDKTKTLVAGLDLESQPENTWLPELKSQDWLPSELIFPKEPAVVFNAGDNAEPVRDYSIPPLKWRVGEGKLISSGFKWRHTTEPTSLDFRYQDLQKMYLALALRLAVAELVSSEELLGGSGVHSSNIDLYITYPLSMSRDERDRLFESYDSAKELVQQRTGVTINVKSKIDESQAGEAGATLSDATQKIFIDVGGGTADISVVVKEVGGRKTEVADSVRYAGNDLLIALANDDELGAHEQTQRKLPGGKISNRSLVELQRKIRFERKSILEDIAIFNNDETKRREALETLERFLRGLTQYLARLIALRVKALGDRGGIEKLDIYLLGQGWLFALALPRVRGHSKTNVRNEIIEEVVTGRLNKELDILKAHDVLSKEPQFKIHHSSDPKRVVARGALQVRDPGLPGDHRHPFLGSDIAVMLPGHTQSYAWHEELPIELDDELNGISISTSLGEFEQSKVPNYRDDGFPLVELNGFDISNRLLRDSEDERSIVSSAFNTYLELWHKRFLHPGKGWF